LFPYGLGLSCYDIIILSYFFGVVTFQPLKTFSLQLRVKGKSSRALMRIFALPQ